MTIKTKEQLQYAIEEIKDEDLKYEPSLMVDVKLLKNLLYYYKYKESALDKVIIKHLKQEENNNE